MDTLTCAICHKKFLRQDTNKWCYHVSFPGPVCSHHHGVQKEYDRLLVQLDKVLKNLEPSD